MDRTLSTGEYCIVDAVILLRLPLKVILNIVSGMVLVWFGPIANNGASSLLSCCHHVRPLKASPFIVVADFGFTLDQVNWFGNVVNVVYLPSAVVVPYLYGRLGLRGTVSALAVPLSPQEIHMI